MENHRQCLIKPLAKCNWQFIHYTQVNVSPNMQFLSIQQHAYQYFLSYFLVLFRLRRCGMPGITIVIQLQCMKVFSHKCTYFW